ncbi:MAG: hypothetical protein O7B99_01535 [Planctomycetota bacterium]|nr:hypothetical protein [Planctomycetota bacterium]
MKLRFLIATALGAVLLGIPADAGPVQTGQAGGSPRFFVSTTSDVAAAPQHPAIDDADLTAVGGATAPLIQMAAGHWLAAAGFAPSDIDGLGRRFGEAPGSHRSFAFSLLSNEAGFLDGDILGLQDGGGVEVLVAEATLVAAMGAAGANVDVDAVAFDASGRLHFSLQADLDGTLFGLVEDGDVLRLEPDGSAVVVLTEADVAQKLFEATGSLAAIGDVLGIDVTAGGEIRVVVQSPSAYDGAVLFCGATGALVLDEDGVGLGGAELDALMEVEPADELPVVRIDPPSAAPGSSILVEFQGEPSAVLLGFPAGTAAYVPSDRVFGFGAFYLDPLDPWLGSALAFTSSWTVGLDATGKAALTYVLPLGVEGIGMGGETGWTFQVIDAATLELSAPFRVRML